MSVEALVQSFEKRFEGCTGKVARPGDGFYSYHLVTAALQRLRLEIAKNKRETLRCEIIEYKGMTLLDLRVYTEIDERRAPTRKGISVKIEMIPQIREWLQQAETEAKAAGLLG